MAFLDCFSDVQTVTATVKRESTGTFSGGRFTTSENTIGSYNTIFYLGNQSEFVSAEKIRENVDGTLIFSPGDDVRVRDKITVDSVEYSAIYVDDVGLQGEAIVVLIQRVA